MNIFTRQRSPKAQQAAEPAAPVLPFHERIMYIPKHAVRDALHSTPAGQRREHKEAMRRAHEERAARIEYERSMQQYALANPKLAISRGPSGTSTPFSNMSRAASIRNIRRLVSRPSSIISISEPIREPASRPPRPETGLDSPYTPSSSAASSVRRSAKRDAVHPRDRFDLPVAAARPKPQIRPKAPARAHTAPVSSSLSPKLELDFDKSLGTEDTWAALSVMMEQMTTEDNSETSTLDLSDSTSASSVYSDDTEEIEIVYYSAHTSPVIPEDEEVRYDSAYSSPVIPEQKQFVPVSPKKTGKMPAKDWAALPSVTKPALSYGPRFFNEASGPALPMRSPLRSVDGISIAPSSSGSSHRRSISSSSSMINAF